MAHLLEGLKVLDLTNNAAGPCACMLMAEHGAEVVHIEKPGIGDDNRHFSPMADGVSAAHMSMNRGKKSVVLDLKDPEAVALLCRMIPEYDIFVQSNRPGVMDRLGLGYEKLSGINPRLIYCSISAFGQKGPYSQKAGYDIIAQAFSGVMDKTGEADGPPYRTGVVYGDSISAINAFGSIMLALYHREKTGRGQHIDIALTRTLMWNNMVFYKQYIGEDYCRSGNHDGHLCPYGVFEGRDGALVLGAVNTRVWQNLCRAMGREALGEDPAFISNERRVARREEVIGIVEDWVRSMPSVDEAKKVLEDCGVPCSKVNRESDLEKDPHIRENGWLRELPAPEDVTSMDSFLGFCGLADFSEGSLVERAARRLGADTEEILEKYGDEKIRSLADE